MRTVRRALSFSVLFGFMVTAAATPDHAHARTARSRQLAPASGYCCLPSQVAKYESMLAVRPVNPEGAVRYVTDLTLVNFAVSNDRHTLPGRTPVFNTIQYFFGRTPAAHGKLFVHHRPRFVVVTETAGQRPWRGISITPVLSGVQNPPIPAGYYSPLMLVTTIPRRHLTIFIESNIPRGRLYLLGERLLHEGHVTGASVRDSRLGVALVLPPGWFRAAKRKVPPCEIAFLSGPREGLDWHQRLFIRLIGLANTRNDARAANRAAGAFVGPYRNTRIRRIVTRLAGAAAVELIGVPSNVANLTFIVAHGGGIYQIETLESSVLQPDQRRALASLRFIPRTGARPSC